MLILFGLDNGKIIGRLATHITSTTSFVKCIRVEVPTKMVGLQFYYFNKSVNLSALAKSLHFFGRCQVLNRPYHRITILVYPP